MLNNLPKFMWLLNRSYNLRGDVICPQCPSANNTRRHLREYFFFLTRVFLLQLSKIQKYATEHFTQGADNVNQLNIRLFKFQNSGS